MYGPDKHEPPGDEYECDEWHRELTGQHWGYYPVYDLYTTHARAAPVPQVKDEGHGRLQIFGVGPAYSVGFRVLGVGPAYSVGLS